LAEFRDFCGVPFAGELDLLRRRINPLNFSRPATLDQQFGECAVSATDVDTLQPRGQVQPAEEILADTPAPDPHHALVSGTVVKPNCHSFT